MGAKREKSRLIDPWSPYAWGRRLLLLWLAALALLGIGCLILERSWLAPFVGMWLVGALVLLALLAVVPRCPECGISAYARWAGRWFARGGPWPAKRCCNCGTDLTV